MNNRSYYHALKINNSQCYGCTHCMRVCPTDAIRVSDGKAQINSDRCVDCGICIKSCPSDAIYLEQDDFQQIFNYKYRVALVPAVFFGLFTTQLSHDQILDVIESIGFTHVFRPEHTCELINEAMLDIQKESEEKPLISAFCPAIVRLIQVKFPALVDNLLLVRPPVDASASFYRKFFKDQGIPDEEVGIFYITPCAAKITAIKSPVGEREQLVDGVINMDLLYNKVFHVINNNPPPEEKQAVSFHSISPKGMLWSMNNGESSNMTGRCLAIDEIHNVIEFLEQLENEEVLTADFLELRACSQGCAGGVLVGGNRYLTVQRMRRRAKRLAMSDLPRRKDLDIYQTYIKENLYLEPITPRSILKLDEDLSIAIEKMQKVRNIMCFLPNIDCGACGAPSCESLARDVVQKERQLSDCIYLQTQMIKNKKLDIDHAIRLIEGVWGEKRLDKNCTKKGAKNEGK